MSRLIDANELYKLPCVHGADGTWICLEDVRNIPTADAEPVKHGQWKRTDAYPHKVYCSECYATLVPNDEWLELYKLSSNYCPNCGAKMEAEDDES